MSLEDAQLPASLREVTPIEEGSEESLHRVNNDRSLVRRKYRAWTGTIWDDYDKNLVKSLESHCKYLLISDDDHTQDGQLHWHCFVNFINPRSMPNITRRTHWEPIKNRAQTRQYCLDKGPNFYEVGDFMVDCGNKSDWECFVNECKLKTGAEMIDGPFSRLYATYRGFAGEVYNTFKKLETIDGELSNEWYWGNPGTGKTKKAWQENPGLYCKAINKWWDGYKGEDVVLLDDWDPKHEVLVSHLKQWADRYPFRCECKGTSMMARPKKIIVTSNYSPEQCFQNEEDVAAIRRRFKVHHFQRYPDQ